MDFKWTFSEEGIDWVELSALYKIAPLGQKEPDDLKHVFENSIFKCFVFYDGCLVGTGRALADGKDCSYICDVAVHPNYQGHGLGRKIVSRLVKMSEGHKKIILYANPGKESFYGKIGFKPMNTAMAIFKDQKHAIEIGLVRET